jgi:hypothetical protein
MGLDARPEVVIPLSKTKVALLLLGALAFVGASVWIWSVADAQPLFNPLYARGVALAGASFFGLCFVYGCIKLFDRRPGLIIDAEGLVDNSSGLAVGRIPWADIIGIRITEISGQRLLTIEVVNPRKYVERGGIFTRMLNAANVKLTGSPINISSNSLRLKFDELVQILTGALETYKGDGLSDPVPPPGPNQGAS